MCTPYRKLQESDFEGGDSDDKVRSEAVQGL